MKPLVIYHAQCPDGFTSAWVVRKKFPDAEFYAAQHGQPPPDVKGRDVIMVDFSYKRPVMEQIVKDCSHLTWLDHHKSAAEDMKGFTAPNLDQVVDMERSGAGIAWDYFFPRLASGFRPWLVSYVQDRDLWAHKLDNSAAVNAYIGTVPYDFKAFDALDEMSCDQVVALGEAVNAKIRQYVTEVSKNARRIKFEGYDVPIVNAPQVNISELVGFLANGEAFAMGWFQRADGKFVYSLRSKGEIANSVDVSEIAKKFGGGGHKNAAGFQLDRMLEF